MTDQITTPAQMREAAAQLVENVIYRFHAGFYCHDTAAAIRAMPVADPLCTWPSCGHTAKGQCRTYTSGQLIAPNDASITATNIPVAEPEPLAVQVRAEALEEAAKLATSFLVGDPQNGVPLRNPMAHEIAAAIRAMKGTKA